MPRNVLSTARQGHVLMRQRDSTRHCRRGPAPPAGAAAPPTVQEYRQSLGLDGASDEELLMHTIMQGDQEINAMRAAGPPKQYLGGSQPLKTLMETLGKLLASATSRCKKAPTRWSCGTPRVRFAALSTGLKKEG